MKPFKRWQQDDIFLHYTGSMYGIGCSAFSKKAIQKICDYKKRSQSKGFIILIPEAGWLEHFSIDYEEDIHRLLQQFWPGNVTFLFSDKKNNFAHLSMEEKIAVRVPESKSLRDFISRIKEPIISTSINREGEEPLTEKKQIEMQFPDWFDYAIPQKDRTKQNLLPSTIIDITKHELICKREGEIPFSMLLTSYEQPKILFVCTANICRSPMAEYVLQHLFQEKEWNYRVASAGFLQGGFPISENSRLVLEENGMDGSYHVSTQINEEIVQDSFLILTMTKNHKEMLLERDEKATNKTFTLLEFMAKVSGNKIQNIDIDDPYGMDITHYRKTYQIIVSAIDRMMPYFKRNAPIKKKRENKV